MSEDKIFFNMSMFLTDTCKYHGTADTKLRLVISNLEAFGSRVSAGTASRKQVREVNYLMSTFMQTLKYAALDSILEVVKTRV